MAVFSKSIFTTLCYIIAKRDSYSEMVKLLFRGIVTEKVTTKVLVDQIKSWDFVKKFIMVFETASREHVHAWVELTTEERDDHLKRCLETMRNRFKYMYKGESKAYSLVKDEGNGNLVYLAKGPSKEVKTAPVVCHNTWCSEEEVREAHDKYWSDRATNETKKRKREDEAGGAKKRKAPESNFQAALDYVNENYETVTGEIAAQIGSNPPEEMVVYVCLEVYYLNRV